MEVKLAVKVLVAMRITNNHGASTVLAKGLFIGSPAYYKIEMYQEIRLGFSKGGKSVIEKLWSISYSVHSEQY